MENANYYYHKVTLMFILQPVSHKISTLSIVCLSITRPSLFSLTFYPQKLNYLFWKILLLVYYIAIICLLIVLTE